METSLTDSLVKFLGSELEKLEFATDVGSCPRCGHEPDEYHAKLCSLGVALSAYRAWSKRRSDIVEEIEHAREAERVRKEVQGD